MIMLRFFDRSTQTTSPAFLASAPVMAPQPLPISSTLSVGFIGIHYELIVKELTEKTGADMHKVKWIYDISSLAVAILLMLLFFHRFSFDQIGVGTLLVTVLNTPLIAMFGKLLDRFVSFDPAFPKFHDWFERIMN